MCSQVLRAAYCYYYAATSVPLMQLMNDALVEAARNNFDVFNALDIMENEVGGLLGGPWVCPFGGEFFLGGPSCGGGGGGARALCPASRPDAQ